MKMKVILLIMLVWFIFLSDLTVSVTYKKVTHTLVWNGLLWVVLDCYTIIKYHSNDKPMKPLIYQ